MRWLFEADFFAMDDLWFPRPFFPHTQNPERLVKFAAAIHTETFRTRYFTATKDKDLPRHLRPKNKISRKIRSIDSPAQTDVINVQTNN